ncbi:MAG: hypothetical protein ACYC91_11610 [Solirubrobacteraceae bacterium]
MRSSTIATAVVPTVAAGDSCVADAIAVLRALRAGSDCQLDLRHHDSERYTAGIEAEVSDECIQFHGGFGRMRGWAI